MYILFLPIGLLAQTLDSAINTEVVKVNTDSIQKYLQEFENLGIKEPGTQALNNTASWIETYHNAWGNSVDIDTFSFGGHQLYNLIINIKGTETPEQVFIVDGHYDTKAGPGVNDNGTGTAILLELARILKNSPPKKTLRIIHFSGEEDGLFGSQHYVNNTLQETTENVILVLNIDEVGGVAGQINNTIVCEYDNSIPTVANAKSVLKTDTLANLVELYSSLNTIKAVAYSSDYMPFQAKEYVITGFFEANETPYAHTIRDSLKHTDVNYVTEIAKATVAASLYFTNNSRESKITGLYNSKINSKVKIDVNDNSVLINNSENQHIVATVYSLNGNIIVSNKLDSNTSLKISNYSSGLYLLKLQFENGEVESFKFVKN